MTTAASAARFTRFYSENANETLTSDIETMARSVDRMNDVLGGWTEVLDMGENTQKMPQQAAASQRHQQSSHSDEGTHVGDEHAQGAGQPAAAVPAQHVKPKAKPKAKAQRASRAKVAPQVRYTELEDRLICHHFEEGLKQNCTKASIGIYVARLFKQRGRDVSDEYIKLIYWRMESNYKKIRMPQKIDGKFLLDGQTA
ncbi:unnamed protein product [Discula destructiva]